MQNDEKHGLQGQRITLNPAKILEHCRTWENCDQLMIVFNSHPNIVGSWGSHLFQFIRVESHENNYFKFSVEARRHKGQIYIFLHANDTFEIYFVSQSKIVGFMNEIYIDEIIERIDERIEKIDSYNPEIK